MNTRWHLGVVLAAAFVQSGCSTKVAVDEVSTDGRSLPEMSAIDVEPNDWPWWRGPNRDGKAVGDTYPVKWSDETNVAWKVEIPGRGHASPTVVGDNIFVATADEGRKLQAVLCYHRKTGALRWRKDVHEGGLGKLDHSDTTFASSTVGCDGKRVFAVFRNDGQIVVTALGVGGDLQWQKKLGGHSTTFGFGSSPVVYKQLVIITADSSDGGFIAALNRKTGDTWWLKKRHKADDYSSAVVANVAGKDQLLLAGGKRVSSYDPMTGDELWSVDGAYAGTTCGTMVWNDDTVFAHSGYGGEETVAIKADGSKSVVWKKGNMNFYVPSTLLHDGYLYGVTNGGIVHCIDVSNGKIAWEKRLRENFYASPILAGGNIYFSSRRGKITVVKPNPQKFELVATNQSGDVMDATPVACRGQLFLRVADQSSGKRQEWLYCIGK